MAEVCLTSAEDTTRYDESGGREQPEILVALEHAPLVERVLRRAGVSPRRVDHSEALLLSRFQLAAADVPRFAGEAARLAAEDGEPGTRALDDARAGLARLLEEDADPEAADGAGGLLRWLRAYFLLRYAGWVPTMGRNRLVAQVNAGGGTVSHGGGPAPVPAPVPAPRAGTAGEGVVVGVLDTALVAHPSFAGRRLASADLLNQQASYPYAAGHATFVTGLVLEQAPGATLLVARGLGPDGQASSWDVANDIVRLGREGVEILNLSLVCYTEDRRPPLALATAIDRLDPRVLVIACAGNHGDPALPIPDQAHRQPAWPAALDDVVAVGSASRATAEPGYELDGYTPRDAPWIDLVSQGELASAYLFGTGEEGETFTGGATWAGTSFSAARLSGRVAAEASVRRIPAREAYLSLMAPLRPGRSARGDWLPPFLDLG